jgi:NAD(P)-dependent dehydrogenase (short-subunit alcohol dehydrogenase family)
MPLALLRTTPLSAVLLAACATEAAAPVEADEPQVAEVAEAPALTVNVLDCGKISISDLDAFSTAGDYAGQADEFGALCAFVCSAHAGYITGQNLLIDGGAYPGTC